MQDISLLPILLLPLIAWLYANVGHGGASGYLAILALSGLSIEFLRPSAWMMNLVVSGTAFVAFYRAGYFKASLLKPFIIASVPMAFMAGSFEINPSLYKILLGSCLALATLRIWFGLYFESKPMESGKPPTLWAGLLAGAVIGGISGLIGIGGGILLSPLILFMGWGTVKEAAAVAAVFIFINSFAGLTGHFISQGITVHAQLPLWLLLVIIGGYFGAGQGSRIFSELAVRRILGVVLALASIKLIFF